MIINEFIEIAKKNSLKKAFLTVKSSKTYQEFLDDISKTIELFKINKIKKQERALIFIPMSYELYVMIMACIMQELQIVMIDNISLGKEIPRINQQIIDASVDYVIVNNKTKVVKRLFKSLNKIKMINIMKYQKMPTIKNLESLVINPQNPCLITYTSGGTSVPKAIIRTLNDLTKQLKKSECLIETIDNEDIVLATLPIYTLLCLVKGMTVALIKKHRLNRDIQKIKPTIMFGSVAPCLALKQSQPQIKYLYIGGSLLYYFESKRLKKLFPTSKVIYIYGATEASIITTTTLDNYLQGIEKGYFILGKVNENISIAHNSEIIIRGEVLTNHYLNQKEIIQEHQTKDLGFIKDDDLYLIGRIIKYHPFITADYYLEMIIKKTFPTLKKVAVLHYENITNIYIEHQNQKVLKLINSFILQNYSQANIIKIKKIPLDYRHNSKVDYKKLID